MTVRDNPPNISRPDGTKEISTIEDNAKIAGTDGIEIEEESLDTNVAATADALVTYISRTLNSVGQDELVSRLSDTGGTQIDPLTTDPLNDVGNDELVSRITDTTGTQVDPQVSKDETKPNLEHGQQDVSAAGTSEALNGGVSLSVPDGAVVTVRAEVASSGDFVYIGDSSVDSSTGFELEDGEGISLAVDDVSTINIDADTTGDGVSWIVEQN